MVLVSPRHASGRRLPALGAEAIAAEVLRGGARLIQLRLKTESRRRALEAALRVREIVASVPGALLIVNDFADIAALVGADGVHVGEEDLPPGAARRIVGDGALVGASAHSVVEAEAALRDGADYLGIGTVYSSKTKPGLKAAGPEGLRSIVTRAVSRVGRIFSASNDARGDGDGDGGRGGAGRLGDSAPGYAIGGITLERVAPVLATGVHGVAVRKAIIERRDIARETALFVAEVERAAAATPARGTR